VPEHRDLPGAPRLVALEPRDRLAQVLGEAGSEEKVSESLWP
jgi:hypothetical protein